MKNNIKKILAGSLFYISTLSVVGCNTTGTNRMQELEDENSSNDAIGASGEDENASNSPIDSASIEIDVPSTILHGIMVCANSAGNPSIDSFPWFTEKIGSILDNFTTIAPVCAPIPGRIRVDNMAKAATNLTSTVKAARHYINNIIKVHESIKAVFCAISRFAGSTSDLEKASDIATAAADIQQQVVNIGMATTASAIMPNVDFTAAAASDSADHDMVNPVNAAVQAIRVAALATAAVYVATNHIMAVVAAAANDLNFTVKHAAAVRVVPSIDIDRRKIDSLITYAGTFILLYEKLYKIQNDFKAYSTSVDKPFIGIPSDIDSLIRALTPRVPETIIAQGTVVGMISADSLMSILEKSSMDQSDKTNVKDYVRKFNSDNDELVKVLVDINGPYIHETTEGERVLIWIRDYLKQVEELSVTETVNKDQSSAPVCILCCDKIKSKEHFVTLPCCKKESKQWSHTECTKISFKCEQQCPICKKGNLVLVSIRLKADS